jgi:hypothetical protein
MDLRDWPVRRVGGSSSIRMFTKVHYARGIAVSLALASAGCSGTPPPPNSWDEMFSTCNYSPATSITIGGVAGTPSSHCIGSIDSSTTGGSAYIDVFLTLQLSDVSIAELEVTVPVNTGPSATPTRLTLAAPPPGYQVLHEDLLPQNGAWVSVNMINGGSESGPQFYAGSIGAVISTAAPDRPSDGSEQTTIDLHFDDLTPPTSAPALAGELSIASITPDSTGGSSGSSGSGGSSGGACGGSACDQCQNWMNMCADNPVSQAPCYCAAACDCACQCDQGCAASNSESAGQLGTMCTFSQ